MSSGGVSRVHATEVLEQVVNGTREVVEQGARLDAALEYIGIVRGIERQLRDALQLAKDKLQSTTSTLDDLRQRFALLRPMSYDELFATPRVAGDPSVSDVPSAVAPSTSFNEKVWKPNDKRKLVLRSFEELQHERGDHILIPVRYMFDAIDGSDLFARIEQEMDLVTAELNGRFTTLLSALDADLRSAKASTIRSALGVLCPSEEGASSSTTPVEPSVPAVEPAASTRTDWAYLAPLQVTEGGEVCV